MTLYDKKREVPESLRRYAEERRASEKRKQQNKEDEASVSSSIWKENESAVSSSQRREAPAALRKYAEERRASEQRKVTRPIDHIEDKQVGVRDWMKSFDSFSKRMSDEYAKRNGVYQDVSVFDKYKNDTQSEALRMKNEAQAYRSYFDNNRSTYGDDAVNEILKALDEGSAYLTDTHDALGSEYDYWSQFKDENEYNEYTRLSSLDLEAAQKELDELNRQMELAKTERDAAYNQLMRADRYGAPDRLLARSGSYEEKDAVYQELSAQVAKLNRDIYNAQHYQDSAKYNAYMQADDFGQYTGTVEPEDSKYMTEDEQRIYNYVLSKEGEDAAQQYMDHLEEAINYRKGKAQGEYIEGIDNWWLKSQLTGVSAAVSGFNNFGRGIKQLFTDEMLATNPQQYADAYLMESLADDGFQVPFTDKSVSQLAYEGISTVTNMAPSILVSAVATKLGAPQAAASLLAAGTLGASAGGNAYTQALQDGYTKDQARNYGIAVGASEGALQYLLGGISKLSGTGNLTNKMLAKVSSIDNGLLRAAAAAGVKGAGEVVEEELQNYLEPLYRKILFNEEYTAPEIEDVVYTAVLTFLTTGVMEGRSIASYASNAPKTYGKEIKGADALQGLIESGLESAPDTESRALAEEMNAKVQAGKTVNDWQVGRLQQANAAAIRAEATETAPEALEDVAREVVARENNEAQAASQQAKNVPYNVMSVDNPARQAAVAQKQRSEDYANALGYGEHGRAALQSISEQAEVSMEQANTEFHLPYLRGLSNMDLSEADVTSDTQLKAFNAGKLDRIQSMNLDAEKSAFATVHGKESGLVQSTASKKLDKKAVAVLNKASKAFGTKTMLVDEIWQKDGKIVPKGTEGAAEADAAMQSNGVMLVSLNAGDPLYTLTKHEFTHRFQQLAPAEYQQYRDAVMQYVVAGDAVAATSTVEGYQNRLGLNVNRSADEIAADFSAYLLKDVNEASRFFDSLLDPKKNTAEQVKKNRNMLERFMDAARAFVQKIKQAFGGDKSKMDAAAQEAFGGTVEQLQELEKLWKQAAQASAKVVQEKVETGAKQEYNGGRKAQFHMKGDSRDGYVGALGKEDYAGSQRAVENGGESTANGRRDGSNGRKDARREKASRLLQTDRDFRRRAETALGIYIREFYDRRVDQLFALYGDSKEDVLVGLYDALEDGKAAFVNEYKGALPEVEMLADRLLAALSVSDPAVVLPTGSYGKADEAYFAAIRKGDYAAAANMVQEAAKANGYTVDVWHGSDTNGITVFRTVSNNEFGLHMGSKQAAEDRLNDTVGSFGYMYHLYMNPGKSKQLPDIFGEYTAMFDYVNYLHGDYEQMSDVDRGFDVVLNDASEFPKNSAFYAMAKQVQNTLYSKARTLADIRKCNELMQKYLRSLGYDSFYYENAAEDEGSTSYIVLDPDRVKSAEVMTFADDGKVIPLSQRFDASKDDIRFSMKKDSEGNALTKEQQEYFKDSVIRDKNGNLMPMYHGTKLGGFTVFDGGKDYWYFTNDEKYAYTFEGRKDSGEFYPVVKEGIESGVYTPQRYKVYLNVKNPFVTDDADIIEDALYWDKTLAGELRKKGYDALMFEDMSQVIVLNANQIKNTTNKKPTDAPDIRFSMKDSAGNKLSQEQAEYFKDSKVRDENGNLKVVYHGSPAQFTKFSYDFMGSTGSAEGRGFYFTDKKAVAEGYQRSGGQLMEGYLSITKPLSLDAKTMKRAELTKLLKAIDPTGDDIASNYDMSGGVGYPSKAWYTRAMNDAVRTIWDGNDNDADMLAEIANSGGSNETVLKTAKELFGYDGYIADGKYDGASVYVAFSSEQFKNADNLNPTSDPDVRFSMKRLEDIKAEYKDKTDHLYLHERSDGTISVDNMVVKKEYRNKGIGTKILSDVIAYADEAGKTITLTPTSEFGTKSKLTRWYKAHGFVENKGKNADYRLSDTMYRLPKGDTQYFVKGQGDLLKENAKLREVNAELREQFKTTKFAKVDKKSLDSFAKKLLKDYQSGADINETRDALDALYTYIANGENGEAPVWQEAYKRAYDTAVEILEQSSELDDQLYQEYKALRDEMRTRGIHLANEYTHDLAGWESINEFRKAHLGSIKMTNDGTPVDVVYQDLAYRYPEFFNEDEYNNPADQLLHIAEVLDSLKPAEVNRYAYNMRESATWMANDIMERFYELPQAKPTFADKAQQKLTKQVIHDAKKLERLRAEKNERIAQVIKREKERTGEVRKKEREKRSKAVKQVKEYYLGKQAAGSERRNSAVLRKRIAQHASDLSKKLLRPTDAQHIPENLRTTVAAVLEAINLESQFTIDPVTGKRSKGGGGDPVKRTEAFRKLKEVYSKILQQEGADMVIDPSLLGNAEEGFDGYFDAVLGMSDTKLADMSLNQLEIVWRVIRAVERSITTAGKMLASKKFESTVEWADAFEEDTDTKRRLKGSKVEALRLDLENPYTFFAHYGKAGEAVFRMLRDAQDAQQRMVEAVNEEVRKIVDPKQVKQWEKEVHEFKTARGEKLVLTAAHMMEIHELMKREQARDHLTKGGIVQPEIKSKKIRRGTDAVLLSLEDIMQIVGKLTQEQMNVADKLQGLMTGILADYGNEASMRAYGYEKFTGTDYFPIKSAKEGVHSNIEKGGNNSRSIKNIGLAKSVIPHASNALDIGGIFSTFASHAADMADYAAWLCPMEDANRLYNFQFRDEMGQRSGFTMKGLLDRYGGNGAQKYWHNLMEDIQNGISAPGDTTVMNIINKGIGNARAASVGANIRVIVQQPTAFLRAAMVLNPADMVKGMAAAATKGGGWKKALKYSEIAKRKDMGGFDISSPAQMNEILFDSKSNLQKFNDAMMWGAGKADAVTWGKIWNACEWAVKGEGKLETGSDEFYERAAELFAEVIDQSQVVDGVLQRSQLMRSSNALVKQATAFMGEPTMALNMMLRAYDGLRNEQDTKKRGAAFKRFGRAAVVLLTTNVVNAFMQSLVDAWRDDDDDEYWEKVMAAFTGLSGEEESPWEKATAAVLSGNVGESLNPVGYIPFAKDLLSILQGYNVTRADADVMADIVSAWQAFADSMWGDGKKTKSNAVWNLAKQVGKVFGISAPNMTRDIYGMLRTIAQDTGNIAARYELEKWIYQVSNEGNANRFTDILYKAYMEDQDVYQHIYDDMKASGFNMDKIQNRMENNMKRDQNVESVSDLKQRYLHPDQQVEYDRKAAAVQSSHLWKEASGEYRDELEEKLYHLVTDSKTGEELQEKIDEGRSYGLSETDYLLYTLALDMYDQPNKNGELGGTPTNEEKAVAIEALGGLSDGAIAYLWDTKSGYEAYAGGADMGAFVEYIGAGGSVSVEKLLDAKSAGIDDDTYYSFLDMLKEYDEPTEGGTMGTFTQDEATAAVRAMPGLTSEERAFLWQSVNSGWKSKNNPWK